MKNEFPANLDEIFSPAADGNVFLTEVYATATIHCLNRIGKSRRREFLEGYLARLAGPDRDPREEGLDDQQMLKHLNQIDPGANIRVDEAIDRQLGSIVDLIDELAAET